MLLVALWTLVLLVILSLGISSRVASEIGFARFLDERVISLYLAKAAVNRAAMELEKDKTGGRDTLYELRKMREIEFGNDKLSYNLLDEERLININVIPQEIIARLPGMTIDLAKEIFIARSKKPFVLKEELLLIDGLTMDIYAQFKEMITVYGSGGVNINTASPDILRILGLGDEIIDVIMKYRAGDDLLEQTKDDGVYTSIPLVIPEQMRYLFNVGSQDMTVDITTQVLGRHQSHYSVVISRLGSKIKFWQER